MKAIRIHGPHDARYEEVPTPEPRADEVLIRVEAAGVCATDREFYEGDMPYIRLGLTRLPIIPGHEWSGEVVEVGKEVTEFRPGDRVAGECSLGCLRCEYCVRGHYSQCLHRRETGLLNKQGGFAEYIRFPSAFLHPLGTVPPEEGAFTEPTGVAVYAVKTARVSPGDNVLVTGCGPIGMLCIQVARAYGANRVAGIDVRDDRVKRAVEIGADTAANTAREDVEAWADQVTRGRRFDVAIEASGNPSAMETIEKVIRPRGRIVVVGLTSGRLVPLPVDAFVIKNLTLYGTLGGPNVWPEAISLMARGLVRPRELITHRLPLEQYVEGLELMRSEAIKVVLKP